MDQTVVTAFERIGQLAHIGEDRVGQRISPAAVRRSERGRESQPLVAQRGRQSGLPLGIDAAQILQVRGVEHRVSGRGVDDVLSRAIDLPAVGVVIEGPFGSRLESVAVDAAQLAARIGVDENFAADGVAGVELPDVDARGQFDQFVPVLRPVDVDVPAPVLGRHGPETRGEFDTPVAHAARVNDHRRGSGGPVGGHVDDLVGGLRIVVGEVERYAVLKEVAFETQLPALDVLGFERVVLRRAGQPVGPGEHRRIGIGSPQLVRLGVVTHVGPRPADLEHVDPLGLVMQFEHLVEQHAGTHRGVEVRVVARSQRRRPGVAARHVEKEHVAPAERDKPVKRIDRLGLARIGEVERAVDVLQDKDVRFFEHVGRLTGVVVLVEHVVAAKRGVERQLTESVVVAHQKIIVEFHAADRLLAVHAVEIGVSVLWFTLSAEIAAEIESRTQRHREPAGNDVPRHAGVAVDPVAGLGVQAVVDDEIRVVHRAVDQLYGGIDSRIVIDQAAALPLVVGVAGRGAHGLPQQGLQGRRVAVSAYRQIVRILAVVVELHARLDVLVTLADGRDAEILRREARIGHDPVVARVLDRDAQRRSVAVAGIHGQAVGVGHAGLEKALVPVVDLVGHARVGIRGRIVRSIHVAHLPLNLFAELVTRSEGVDLLSRVGMIGVDRVERIFVGIQTVGHVTVVDRGFAVVARAVLILEIGPVTRLVEGHRGRERHAQPLLLAARLGGDDDGAVGRARSVESRGRRAFEHRDRLHVVGVDVPGAVAVVDRGVVRLVGTRR